MLKKCLALAVFVVCMHGAVSNVVEKNFAELQFGAPRTVSLLYYSGDPISGARNNEALAFFERVAEACYL